MNLLNSILRLTIPVFGVLLGFLTPQRAEADPFARVQFKVLGKRICSQGDGLIG
jgi:surface polysaccharide O-acyltransferase-like enzyme